MPAASIPWNNARPERATLAFSLAVWVVSFLVYLTTVAPTVAFNDAARFQIAAPLLGLGHPTGYPTFILTGKLFTYLPFGDVAFRVNLMSAFFGAVAAALLCATALRLGARPLPAVGAGLLLAFSSTFWFQANIAEVYTMHAAFILGVLYLVLLWREGGRRSGLYLGASALLFGASLGNNAGMVLLVPAILVLLFYRRPHRLSFGLFAACAALLLAGLSVYLYVPIRGFAGAWHNYGDPVRDWQDVWNLISASRFQGLMGASPLEMASNAGYFLWNLSLQAVHPWGFGLAAISVVGAAYGATRLLRREAALGMALVLAFLVTLLYALNYQIDDIRVYFLPVYVFLFLFLAIAASGLSGCLRRSPRFAALAALPVLALAVLALNYPGHDMSGFYAERLEAERTLAVLPEDAVLYGKAGILSSSYLQQVEGERQDVKLRWLDGGTTKDHLKDDLESGRPVYFVNDPRYVYDYTQGAQDIADFRWGNDFVRLVPE